MTTVSSITPASLGDFSYPVFQDLDDSDLQLSSNTLLLSFWNLWKKNLFYEFASTYTNSSSIDEQILGENENKKLNRTEKRGSVRFSHVEIREHRVTLGEHPCCKLYPVTLDWDHAEIVTVGIDEHTRNRQMKSIARINENPKKRNTRAFQLRTQERFRRLALVSGMEGAELFNLEKDRHEKMIIEERRLQEQEDAS
jgi:hypothetical protein